MNVERNRAIEYIRGISMLGVVGIHTGAYSLSNPDVNVHLFALLEICSRFSVPIFFFISAFGLFYKQDLSRPLDYGRFLLRRGRSVLVPYLLWSLLYMSHYTWVSGDASIWDAPLVYEYFFFGLASYQLYFLVILCWFYLLMPLWRRCARAMGKAPVSSLTVLLVAQIAFNYYSSYMITVTSDNYYIQQALQFRLSYWVLHYVFIFLLGALCAIKLDSFERLIRQYRRWLMYCFLATLSGMLTHYYLLLSRFGYTPEMAVNTVHQLSPIGVLYTAAATLYGYTVFSQSSSRWIASLFGILGRFSYPVYLVHPLWMYYLSKYLEDNAWQMDVPVTLLFFSLTVVLSVLTGKAIHQASAFWPHLGECLLGLKAKPVKTGTP